MKTGKNRKSGANHTECFLKDKLRLAHVDVVINRVPLGLSKAIGE